METKFYVFSQNNSGGSFVVDDKLCHRLLVEATNSEEACNIAENMGIYFDGCEKGWDCDCCGDRWYPPTELKFPLTWDTSTSFDTPESYMQHLADNYGWTKPDGRIFYKNGRIIEIYGNR